MTYRAWEQKPLDRTAVRELTAAIAEQAAAQLEEQAMDEAPWSDEKYKAVLAAQQKENALLAGILAARGITDPAEALTLLAGEEELSDPALLTDMDAACQRIWQAIDNSETIAVFGDYDVDGVTATALLYQHLKGMGATVKCMLPSREGDGYGLSKNAIQSMHNKGCTLIVTVDNGISAVEEADFAASLGMDLIITDHHLPPETLPKAVAVVDPRREDDHSPFKGLCGAGVAFKLCAALDGCPPEEMLDYCGDLAAVGTVADVMPLVGENRTLVKAGLRQLQQTDRPGFGALLEEVGLAGKPTSPQRISATPSRPASMRQAAWITQSPLCSWCSARTRTEPRSWRINSMRSTPTGRRPSSRSSKLPRNCWNSSPSGWMTASCCCGDGTGIPASSALWRPGWWSAPDARSSWSPLTSMARARAAGAACRVLTCTPASAPVPTFWCVTAVMPWRRDFPSGRKFARNCAAA